MYSGDRMVATICFRRCMQLVWKGKDEQDRADLAVPAVPIYIQEKIHPQAIIENVRAHSSPCGRGSGQERHQPS